MTTEVRVPQLPESVADATLVTWHKKAGDPVNRDENLADLETDKVVLEVPAPVTGVLTALKKDAGTTVGSGELLAIIEEAAAATQAKTPARKVAAQPAKPAPARKDWPGAGRPRRRARTQPWRPCHGDRLWQAGRSEKAVAPRHGRHA